MNKIFVARTRSALKSRAQLGNMDLNDYVILSLNDKARQNKVIKSVAPQVEDEDYKFIMLHKSFVVITTDGGLRVDTNMIGTNSYAEELNTPEEEAPGDKYVKEGKVKSILAKVAQVKGLSDEEKDTITDALKSWGEHHGEEVSKDEEFVDELEAKSQHTEDEDRPSTEEDSDSDNPFVEKSAAAGEEDEDEDDVTKSLQSIREKVSGIVSPDVRSELISSLKSFGSIDPERPVFQSKHAAQRFSQVYNNKVSGTDRAEVEAADRHTRQRYGTKARFIVTFE